MQILLSFRYPETHDYLKSLLQQKGYTVTLVDPELCLDFALTLSYEALILEGPDPLSQISLIRKIRRKKPRTPIIGLSLDEDISLTVKLLNAGADHVITQRYNSEVEISHLTSIENRYRGLTSPHVSLGELSADLTKNILFQTTRPSRVFHTRTKHIQILLMLLANPQGLTAEAIHEKLYGHEDETPDIRVINVYLSKIKSDLENLRIEINPIPYLHRRGKVFFLSLETTSRSKTGPKPKRKIRVHHSKKKKLIPGKAQAPTQS